MSRARNRRRRERQRTVFVHVAWGDLDDLDELAAAYDDGLLAQLLACPGPGHGLSHPSDSGAESPERRGGQGSAPGPIA